MKAFNKAGHGKPIYATTITREERGTWKLDVNSVNRKLSIFGEICRRYLKVQLGHIETHGRTSIERFI